MSSSAQFSEHTAPLQGLEPRLSITLGDEVPRSQAGQNLLLGFHFGRSKPEPSDPALVSIGVDPVGSDDLYECWWYDGAVEHSRSGRARILRCDDFAAIVVQVPDAPPENFHALTVEVYEELLQAVNSIGGVQLARIWNYFSNINEGDGDQEKYRQFSIGRAEVFESFGLNDASVPTGTAVGSARDCDFSVVALATRHHFRNVENPRQVSAFRYPRDYGPRSPKFSRGGCVITGGQHLQLISGTAAIIGHESVHAGDTALQCEVTLANLQQLCDAMSLIEGAGARVVLDDQAALRVYLRDPADRPFVDARLREFLGGESRTIAFLNADICRSELQLEIEAAKVVGAVS